MSIPVLKLVCQGCGEEFPVSPGHFAGLGFRHMPKRCPTCCDLRQGRPSVIVDRSILNLYDGVEIASLPPGEWEESRGWDKDVPACKLTIKGDRYGASWSGRIDLFALRAPEKGDIVSIREMEAQHRVKVVRELRSTLEYGSVTVEREIPITTTEEEEPEAEKVIRTRKYLVIEPFDGPATSRLVWAEAHTKTTLKGFGRQYWASITGDPVASWIVSGGYRSGRAGTTGALAIVSEDRPLVVEKTGDISGEEVYQ